MYKTHFFTQNRTSKEGARLIYEYVWKFKVISWLQTNGETLEANNKKILLSLWNADTNEAINIEKSKKYIFEGVKIWFSGGNYSKADFWTFTLGLFSNGDKKNEIAEA